MGGGYLLLGVAKADDENKYVASGVSDPDKLQNELVSLCSSSFSSTIRPKITVKKASNGNTVILAYIEEVSPLLKPISFEVKSGSKNHQKIKRVAYRRIGSADVLCTPEDYAEFTALKQDRPYDETILSGVSMEDINPVAVEEYRRMRRKNHPNASELQLSDSELLLALHCAEKNGDIIIPTIAGLILFGTDSVLRRYFSMMRVDYVRTQALKWSDLATQNSYYSLELREAALTLLPKAEAAIMANIEREISITSDTLARNERPVLPHDVVREALVNAVMHRDYRQNGPTMVIQYPDRIEFFNHGYSLKPLDDFETFGGSKTRNLTIANVLHETEYAENKGSGIVKIRRLMKNANLEEPVFLSDRERNTFSATFYLHQFIDDDALAWLSQFTEFNLSSKEARVLVFAYKEGTITNGDGRAITGLDTLSVSRILTDLRKKGILEQHSNGPSTYYTLSSLYNPKNLVESDSESFVPEISTKSGPINTKSGMINTKLESISTKSGMINTKIDDEKIMENSSSELYSVDAERTLLLNMLEAPLCEEILGLGNHLSAEVTEKYILRVCKERAFSASEISIIFGRGRFWSKKPLKSLIASGKISLTIPEKPNSRNQAYYTSPVDKQQKKLDEWE